MSTAPHIHAEPLTVRLREPFRIAHGTSTERTNVLVRIDEGFGEAGLPPYYGVDAAQAAAWIAEVKLPDWPSDVPPPVAAWIADLQHVAEPARCAVDLALHDLWGRRIGQPLHTLFGLDPAAAPPTFNTLTIPTHAGELAAAAGSFGVTDQLKLKLGTGDAERDIHLVQAVREAFDGILAVDANGAWSIPEAVGTLPRLAELDIAFIEQPIDSDDPEDWHLLRRMIGHRTSLPPLIADESARTVDDIIALAGAADGVNVKLAKCGGLAAARAVIQVARALDLSVLLGCMVESSLAVTAAAHLAPLADWLDLDAPMLVRDDPFDGVQFDGQRLVMPKRPGIGAVRV